MGFWHRGMYSTNRDSCCFRMPAVSLPIANYICDTSPRGLGRMLWSSQLEDYRARTGFLFSSSPYGSMAAPNPYNTAMRFGMLGSSYDEMFDNIWKSMGYDVPTRRTRQEEGDSEGEETVTPEDKVKQKRIEREYKALKVLVETYLATNPKSKVKDEIQAALEVTGKTEKRLEALQEVYERLDKSKVKKAISAITAADYAYRAELEIAGYRFGSGDYASKNADDAKINNTVNELYTSLSTLATDNDHYQSSVFNGTIANSITSGNILRLISYWNDKYNGSKERSIIRLVNEKIPAKDAECSYAAKAYLNPLVTALTTKAEDIKSNLDDDSVISAIDAQITSLNKAYEKAIKENTDDKNVAKSKKNMSALNKLADEFEKLYVLCRKLEAERINEDFNTQFGFLNDISEDDVDVATKTAIIKDTNADLKAEGLDKTVVTTTVTQSDDEDSQEVTVPTDGATPSSGADVTGGATIQGLDKECLIPLSDKYEDQEIFRLADCMNKKDLYTIVDGKLVKIVGLEYKNGEFKLKSGYEKVTYQEVSVAGLQAEYEAAKEKAEAKPTKPAGASGGKTEEKPEAEQVPETPEELALSEAELKKAQKTANKVYEYLDGNTSKDEWRKIEAQLKNVDSKNVMDFLYTFQQNPKNDKIKSTVASTLREVDYEIMQGFFTHVLTEWEISWNPATWGGSEAIAEFKNKAVQTVLNALIQSAEERIPFLSAENQEEIQEAIEKLSEYKDQEDLSGSDGEEMDILAAQIIRLCWSVNHSGEEYPEDEE